MAGGRARTWLDRIRGKKETFIDGKTLNKACKAMEKVVKLCSNPRLALSSRSPNILEILPDTSRHLRVIFEHYEKNVAFLNENEFFRIFIDNLTNKCDQTVHLFKDAKEKIFDETSPSRRSLTKVSLIFSHMLAELKAMFPKGAYEGETFRATEEGAAAFWAASFQTR